MIIAITLSNRQLQTLAASQCASQLHMALPPLRVESRHSVPLSGPDWATIGCLEPTVGGEWANSNHASTQETSTADQEQVQPHARPCWAHSGATPKSDRQEEPSRGEEGQRITQAQSCLCLGDPFSPLNEPL